MATWRVKVEQIVRYSVMIDVSAGSLSEAITEALGNANDGEVQLEYEDDVTPPTVFSVTDVALDGMTYDHETAEDDGFKMIGLNLESRGLEFCDAGEIDAHWDRRAVEKAMATPKGTDVSPRSV